MYLMVYVREYHFIPLQRTSAITNTLSPPLVLNNQGLLYMVLNSILGMLHYAIPLKLNSSYHFVYPSCTPIAVRSFFGLHIQGMDKIMETLRMATLKERKLVVLNVLTFVYSL
jgi:hypothetical protein